LANELGFSVVRTWYIMRIGLSAELPSVAVPAGVTIRTFVPGQDEAMLTSVIDDCFWDHWGEGEHTLEETVHDVHLPMFDRELLLFAEREGQVLGYCWSWIEPTRSRVTGDNCAYIGDLGVRLAFRHQGVGRALLLRSLTEIKSRGATAAELDMDGPNVKARLLYESVGFFPHIEVRWFRLPF
jgi:mycothiol synthase